MPVPGLIRLPAPLPPSAMTPETVVVPVPESVSARPVLLSERLMLPMVTAPVLLLVSVLLPPELVRAPVTEMFEAPDSVRLLESVTVLNVSPPVLVLFQVWAAATVTGALKISVLAVLLVMPSPEIDKMKPLLAKLYAEPPVLKVRPLAAPAAVKVRL